MPITVHTKATTNRQLDDQSTALPALLRCSRLLDGGMHSLIWLLEGCKEGFAARLLCSYAIGKATGPQGLNPHVFFCWPALDHTPCVSSWQFMRCHHILVTSFQKLSSRTPRPVSAYTWILSCFVCSAPTCKSRQVHGKGRVPVAQLRGNRGGGRKLAYCLSQLILIPP